MFQIYSARFVALWQACIGMIHGAWTGNRGPGQARWDAISITSGAAAACLVEYHYDFAPLVLQFGLDHADWEIDNLLFTLVIMSVALVIFGYGRQSAAAESPAACRCRPDRPVLSGQSWRSRPPSLRM
jgi:hypothetical protein